MESLFKHIQNEFDFDGIEQTELTMPQWVYEPMQEEVLEPTEFVSPSMTDMDFWVRQVLGDNWQQEFNQPIETQFSNPSQTQTTEEGVWSTEEGTYSPVPQVNGTYQIEDYVNIFDESNESTPRATVNASEEDEELDEVDSPQSDESLHYDIVSHRVRGTEVVYEIKIDGISDSLQNVRRHVGRQFPVWENHVETYWRTHYLQRPTITTLRRSGRYSTEELRRFSRRSTIYQRIRETAIEEALWEEEQT